MTARNIDPGLSPTAPCSVTVISGEEAQNVCLVDGASLTPLGTNANPFRFAERTPSNSTSSAQEASRVVKASAGTLFVVSGFNNHTADQYIQIFDAAALPANGVVPAIVIRAFTGEPFGYSAPAGGRAFTTGIVICNSTTGPTKTIGSANCLFDVQYV